METRPFEMQAPEGIAKDYAGNKQKISAAMQQGLLDPTAATLAGMFIDRMVAAQAQAPTQTVAEQTFNPQPQQPPQQGAPQQGLGATPQGQGMQGPPPQQGQPPMMAASGGLLSMPVPNNMPVVVLLRLLVQGKLTKTMLSGYVYLEKKREGNFWKHAPSDRTANHNTH